MSRLSRQLGLPRRSRFTGPLRRMLMAFEFPLRAPSTPGGVAPRITPSTVGANYDTNWARSTPARVARAALVEGPMRLAVAGLAAPERSGTDRLADVDGPLIFAANHHSHLDTPLLLTSIPEPWRHRTVVAAAADYFFPNRVAATFSALTIGAVPIERNKVGRRSADLAAKLLDEGWSLLIYPEGGRSPDGWGQEFRGGAAYLSARTGVPVAPIHLAGTGRILRKGRRLPRPSHTTVTFGRPLRPLDGENANRFATRIEREVAGLADEATSTWYQARRRAYADATPGLTGPETGRWRRAWALGDRQRGAKPRARLWPDL